MSAQDDEEIPEDAPGLNDGKLTDWLSEHTNEFSPPFTFTRVGEGQSALSYRIEDDRGRTLILRRPPLGELLESSHNMAREHYILSCLEKVTEKVPRILGLCEDFGIIGAPFYLMECVEGLSLNRRPIAERLSTSARSATGHSLITVLGELQTIDLDRTGLSELRRSSSFIERQLRRWTRQWHAQKTRELPLVENMSELLAAQMPEESETVLVHGDFGLHNVIVGNSGNVRTVLDWELCTVGDRLADLAQMIVYWSESGAPAGHADSVFKDSVTDLEGFASVRELADMYAVAFDKDVTKLGYWMAFAYWKTAIIVEGVYSRWLENPANGSGAGELSSAVPRLAELAYDSLKTGV